MSLNTVHINKLTGRDNYNSWKFAVKSYLEHEELWSCVDPTTSEKIVDNTKDLKAKSKLILLVDPSNYHHIDEAKNAREVWVKLQSAFEDSGLNRKVALLRDLTNTSLDSCTDIDDYLNKLVTTSHKLRNIGFKVDDEWLGTLMLAGLPDQYKPMIMGLESSGVKISADLIKTKLLQEVKKESNTNALYTKHKHPHKKNYTPPHHQNKPRGPRCYNCNRFGHFSRDCTSEKKDNSNTNKNYAAVFSANTAMDDCDWYVDSGASMHMTRRSDWLYEIKTPPIQSIKVANNSAVTVQKMGNLDLNLCCDDGKVNPVQVRDILFIPELSTNLLSVSQLAKNGCRVNFHSTGCNIYNKEKHLVATASLINNMYKLNTIGGDAYISAADSTESLDIWHRRMGHLNYADVKKLETSTEGVKITYSDSKTCIPCIEGKQTRLPFKNEGSRATSQLEVIHSDLCGPMECSSLGGAKYFITFIDDYSRKVFVYFLKNKMDITSVFHNFKCEVENELGQKIKIIRTDNGTEYCNNDFSKYLSDSGIKHQTTTPYTPEQNGLSERKNRTLVERTKCMLRDANLPKIYWAEALSTAAYIINRSPSRVLNDMTPEEKWSGRKPNISHMKIFGCKAMVHVPKQHRCKWDSKSTETRFVGYCQNTKGYRLLDMKRNVIVKSRDVVFIEESQESSKLTPPTTEQSLQTVSLDFDKNTASTEVQTLEESRSESDTMSETSISFSDANDTTYIPSSEQIADDSIIEQQISNVTLRPRHQNRVRTDGVTAESDDNLYYACLAICNDPTTLEDALTCTNSYQWIQAMDEEYKSLMNNNTWILTKLPPGKKAIPCKWVYKTKTDEEGNISKYKARLVIKGCAQKKGIDYEEVYSPVIRYTSLRYLLALATKYDLDIDQMDAVSAFLQGDVEEEIYMLQPPTYETDNDTDVCLLKKSLYGLKQASRNWNKKLDATLKEIGLSRSSIDPCIYYKIASERDITFLAIYVDDLILFTNCQSSKINLKQKLCERFNMKDMGELKYCIGLHVTRDRKNGNMYIDQRKYIQEILQRYGMSDCKPVKTPIDPLMKLQSTGEEAAILRNIPYQEIIGCLLYLSQGTRPDICYAVNYLSKYNSKPEMKHWVTLKRVLRYLKGTENYRLTYKRCQDEDIAHAYCDADWANSEDDRRSCTGYTFLFQGGSICWNSKRQPTVALSTTEAEYMSLSACTQEALWLKQLQEEFWPHLRHQPIVVYCDNQSCIKLSGTDGYNCRTKHIDVRHHFVRDKINEKKIEVHYVNTAEMVADMLTKATPQAKLHYLSCKMGLCSREDVANREHKTCDTQRHLLFSSL